MSHTCISDCDEEEISGIRALRNGACGVYEDWSSGDITPKQAILKGVLSALYIKTSQGGSYNLLAHASADPKLDFMNVAYPDFS